MAENHTRGTQRHTSIRAAGSGRRAGRPEPRPWVRRPGEAERDAQVAAMVAAAKAAARSGCETAPPAGQVDDAGPVSDRCEACGYRTAAAGHRVQCGGMP